LSDLIWEVLELDLHSERFYVQLFGERVKEIPAFILMPPYNPLNPYKSYWVLLMNRVGIVGKYHTRKEAYQVLRNITRKTSYPLKLWRAPIGTTEKLEWE